MRQLSNQFTPAIDTLTQQFGQLVEEARVRLGGLFRSEDYPAPEELRSKFSFAGLAQSEPLRCGGFLIPEGRRASLCASRRKCATCKCLDKRPDV